MWVTCWPAAGSQDCHRALQLFPDLTGQLLDARALIHAHAQDIDIKRAPQANWKESPWEYSTPHINQSQMAEQIELVH